MSEEDGLAVRVEADVAPPAALVEAPVRAGDSELAALSAFAARRIGADPALGGGGGGERVGPAGLEGGIAAARAVKAHQREAGGESGIFAAFAVPEARQEIRLGCLIDAALTPARIVLPAHPRL